MGEAQVNRFGAPDRVMFRAAIGWKAEVGGIPLNRRD
jgi:hypothetical protein